MVTNKKTKFITNEKIALLHIIVFCLILIGIIIYGSYYRIGKSVKEGDIALRDLYAPYDFRYPWGINEEKTKEIKEQAVKNAPLVFDVDNSVEETALGNLKIFFNGLEGIKNTGDKELKNKSINDLRDASKIDVPDNEIIYFAHRAKDKNDAVLSSLTQGVKNLYPIGIVNLEPLGYDGMNAKFIKIRNEKLNSERIYNVSEMPTIERATNLARAAIAKDFNKDTRLRNHILLLINRIMAPNTKFNAEETQHFKDKIISGIKPLYNMIDVKKDELIVERGQRVTKQHMSQLMQLGIGSAMSTKGEYLIGMFLLITLLTLMSIFYMYIVERKLSKNPIEVAIILINCLLVIIFGQFVIGTSQPIYSIPLAGISILLVLLVRTNAAIVSTIVVSVFLGLIAGGKVDLTTVLLIGGITGIFFARDARRRSKLILAGLIAGIMQFMAIIAIGLVNNLEFKIFIFNAVWGLVGGVISIFIAMGLLPLFEYIFKITTNITLLELSDLNHPILKSLILKAPGTYQHSIMVGNLAEAACEAIGANSLLARVGSYYHDIGKMEKAEYFTENEMGTGSKHEKLTPSMSALIIVNHVKDGVDLAKKHNLNSKLIEFIEEHHGTGLIYYFYQRALEKTDEDEEPQEEEFRYPGPKPQTKESAIVLLADSVEAASRALDEPTPARIRSLVQKIMNNKFIDNQLDECDLTLKDLNKISEAFVHLLMAVFHTRLEYPDVNDIALKKTNGKIKHNESQ